MNLNIQSEVDDANSRIGPFIRKTPLEFSPALSELCNCKVYLKLENWQVTGSFKVRGALNKILPLTTDSNEGVVTASTGNHAAGVAHSLEQKGLEGTIFLPENVPATKVEKLKYYNGVNLKYFGTDSVETEKEAKDYALENGLAYISPYNDIEVISGQGTIGLEILGQLENVDVVFVPVGGGGLISGISGYLKSVNRSIEIVGCQPENSKVMYESVRKGHVLDLPSLPTISDGTAGGVEEDSITFDFCKELVDTWVLVNEEEILEALKIIMRKHNMIVEGSAALALAALKKKKERYIDKSVVLILCGGKFSEDLLKKIAGI